MRKNVFKLVGSHSTSITLPNEFIQGIEVESNDYFSFSSVSNFR
jgi:hypothetical protein